MSVFVAIAVLVGSPILVVFLFRKAGVDSGPLVAMCAPAAGVLAAYVFYATHPIHEGSGGWFGIVILLGTVVIGLLGHLTVLGLSCLGLAFSRRGKTVKTECLVIGAFFLSFPAIAIGSQIQSFYREKSRTATAKRWADFLVEHRTNPTRRELSEIRKNRKIRAALFDAIVWGDSDYADAWEFLWKKDALESLAKARRISCDYQTMLNARDDLILLLRHGRNPDELANLPEKFLRHCHKYLPLIMDNPRLRDTPIAAQLMEFANNDPYGRSDEELKEMLVKSAPPIDKAHIEETWQLIQWDKKARAHPDRFDRKKFKQWLRLPGSGGVRNWLRNRISSDNELEKLRNPELIAVLVNEDVLPMGTAEVIAFHHPWGSDEWRRFLHELPKERRSEIPEHMPTFNPSPSLIAILSLLIEQGVEPDAAKSRLHGYYESQLRNKW